MFWRKKKKFTDQAIAYIKASNPEGGGRVIELPPEATPVVRRYSDDLCICYTVDCDKHYEYVQECHLPLDGIDRDELHSLCETIFQKTRTATLYVVRSRR